jgi:hydroxymethylbilane synthase
VRVRLRVGTRGSPLARAQTSIVVDSLTRRRGPVGFEIVPIVPSGDRSLRPGASPDFTDALDRALLDGRIDLAVHSAKDLPSTLDPRLTLAACPDRRDPRDALVVRGRRSRATVARGGRVGSSSPRRRAQLLRWRPDLEVVEIRGNVGRRLDLVDRGEVDAAVLAVAGLERLGRSEAIARILSTGRFLPAPAQGALAVLTRTDAPELGRLVGEIDRPAVRACVVAERQVADTLHADCRMPLAALATSHRGVLALRAEVLHPSGRGSVRARAQGPATRAADLGRDAGARLLDQGARELALRAPSADADP